MNPRHEVPELLFHVGKEQLNKLTTSNIKTDVIHTIGFGVVRGQEANSPFPSGMASINYFVGGYHTNVRCPVSCRMAFKTAY